MLKITKAAVRKENIPEFSWKLQGDEGQKSYRITVKNSAGEVFWDSGEVESSARHNITLEKELKKEEIYVWSVRVVGENGSEDICEGEAFISSISNWNAKWVEPVRERKPLTDSLEPMKPVASEHVQKDALDRLDPAVYIRKKFTVDSDLEKAICYTTAHGIYALYVNGNLVSDLFAPGYTTYSKHIDYQAMDVTKYVKSGENELMFILADGWYTGKIGAMGVGHQYGEENALLSELVLTGKDGVCTRICTDETAEWSEGAIRYADLYVGEYRDERVNDFEWKPVRIADYGYEILELQSIPGVREIRTITPKIVKTPKGELLLDAGENIVGYVSFELDTKEGQVISLEHSESLDENGNYIQNIIGQNKDQTDYFVAGRNEKSEYKPLLTFHGFRYVRVTGTNDENPEHYTIHVISTPLDRTGSFSCSDERLNRLHENVVRSQEGNMISIPTDCPQRERTGWMGDIQVYAPTGCLEQDIEQFLRHWFKDVRHEQLENGEMPHIVPTMPSHDIMKPAGIKGTTAAGWSDAAIIVPWRLYEAYGDKRILEENFDLIRTYMASVEECVAELPEGAEAMDDERKSYQKYIWNTGFQYGDWLMPSIQMSGRPIFEVVQQTGYVVATLMYILTTEIMADICNVLNEEKLEAHYRETNKLVKEAFCKEYINADGTFKKDYQGVYVLALKTGTVTGTNAENALNRLVKLIEENNNLLDTGFLSVSYLLPVLKESGRKDIANMLLFRDECPSWLYEVKMGATTMWEYWNGVAENGKPDDCSMNHFAFGCVGEYLFKDILGINPLKPGYAEVEINPDIESGLDYAEGSYDSIWGKIGVAWKLEKGVLSLDIELPPDVTARVAGQTDVVRCGRHHFEIDSAQVISSSSDCA